MADGEVIRVVEDGGIDRQYAPILNARAREAGYRGYKGYLRSRYWRDVRLRVLERDDHKCCRCGSGVELTVHHDRYDYIGRERLEFLKTFCHSCHSAIHGHGRGAVRHKT